MSLHAASRTASIPLPGARATVPRRSRRPVARRRPSRRERSSVSSDASRPDASADAAASAAVVSGVAPRSRRVALVSAIGLASVATFGTPLPARAGNPLSDFADGQLQSKARLFMGPLQLTLDRLAELRASEAALSVDELGKTLGAATMDCLNPRGPLAAYASVRDVCTLKILLRSATEGPAIRNDVDGPLARAAAEALVDLQGSYDDLAEELAREPGEGTRDAAFGACERKVKVFAAAILACFRLEERRNDAVRETFPELFAAA